MEYRVPVEQVDAREEEGSVQDFRAVSMEEFSEPCGGGTGVSSGGGSSSRGGSGGNGARGGMGGALSGGSGAGTGKKSRRKIGGGGGMGGSGAMRDGGKGGNISRPEVAPQTPGAARSTRTAMARRRMGTSGKCSTLRLVFPKEDGARTRWLISFFWVR